MYMCVVRVQVQGVTIMKPTLNWRNSGIVGRRKLHGAIKVTTSAIYTMTYFPRSQMQPAVYVLCFTWMRYVSIYYTYLLIYCSFMVTSILLCVYVIFRGRGGRSNILKYCIHIQLLLLWWFVDDLKILGYKSTQVKS